MLNEDTGSKVPPGFERHPRRSPLTEPWEPIFSKTTSEAVIIALRLAQPHTNSRGLIHGGLIASLADNAMGLSCVLGMSEPRRLVTVSLSVDFLATARIGQWLAVETNFVKLGRSICFGQSLVLADDIAIARANATFKISKEKHA